MSATMTRPSAAAVRPAWQVMARKELRENARWALLAALALAAAIGFESYQASTSEEAFWNSLDQVMLFGAPLTALLLGLLQVIPEQRRDLFAFVVHRPAARTSLFWGKVTTGIALYALATLPPFLGAVFWARTPGNLSGPFVWGLTEAGLASLIAGLPFYFAALLVVLRPAPWFGSRLIPVIAAIVAAAPLDVNGVGTFPVCAAICLVLTAALLAAARISYETAGGLSPRNQRALAPVGIALYAGGALALFAVFALGYSAIRWLSGRQVSEGDYSSYIILSSGEFAEQRMSRGTTTYLPLRDGEGRPESLVHNTHDDGGSQGNFLWEGVPQDQGFRNPNNFVTHVSVPNLGSWYWLPNERRFIAYGRRLPDFVIGPHGKAPYARAESAGRFADPISPLSQSGDTNIIVLVAGDGTYTIDASDGTVSKVPIPAGDHIVASAFLNAAGWPGRDPEATLSATTPIAVLASHDRFYVLTFGGAIMFSAPREYRGKDWWGVSAVSTPETGNVYLWYHNAVTYHSDVVTLWDRAGHEIATFAPPPLWSLEPADPSDKIAGPLIPPVLYIGAYTYGVVVSHHSAADAKSFHDTIRNPEVRRMALTGLISGLICAVMAWAIARRRTVTARSAGTWAAAALLFGIPMLMTLVALVPNPARIPCPRCGKRRIVTRDICEHCGEPFPGPARDGTEIFERAVAETNGASSIPSPTAIA